MKLFEAIDVILRSEDFERVERAVVGVENAAHRAREELETLRLKLAEREGFRP